MNRKLILSMLFALAGGIAGLFAQDLIVKTDATQVEARVLEISPEQIRYKRFSNPDGPTYVLPVETVEYIRYANGEIDRFRPEQPAQPKPQPEPQPQPEPPVQPEEVTPQTPQTLPANPPRYVMPVPQQQQQQPAAASGRAYDIGDYYNENGIEGIVCQVSDDRMHGLIVSLDELMLPWYGYDKNEARSIGADNADDGRANMETVAAYIAANGASWEDFPAFKWCRDKGEGWYLPAVNEVLSLGNSFNGGSRMKFDRTARNRFNDNLKSHGGKRLDRLVYYFSSTEKDAKSAYTSHMDLEPPFVVDIPKHNRFLVRAMHRF